jgi:hypothetical protein
LLALEDLFAVGVGFDIAGAGLLGYGLLSSPREISTRAVSRLEFSPVLVISQAMDKVDAIVGLAALVVGFSLQVVAYAVILARVTERSPSIAAGLVALGLAVIAVASVLFLWRFFRWRLLRRQLVEVAKVNYLANPPVTMNRPYAHLLNLYAEELGYTRPKHESPNDFARRVFGIDQVLDSGLRPVES